MEKFLPVKLYSSPSSYDFDKINKMKELEIEYQRRLAFKNQDLENSEKNAVIHSENIKQYHEIIDLAKSYGFKVNEYVSSRGKTKSHYKDEKWVSELSKQLPSSGGYYSAIYTPKHVSDFYESLEGYYKERKEKLSIQERRIQESFDAEEERRNKEKLAIRLAVKYDLDEKYNDRESIYEQLLNKDKYIMLADAMEKTRGDWSDGFYRVEYAVEKFNIEDERDTEIITDIVLCLDGEDGRVFRDTHWNYTKVYMLGNQELLEDIIKISGE